MQISMFLNLENGDLFLGEYSLTDNSQDNGLCIQNTSFDYLLDKEGNRIRVSAGDVYVPICYRDEYNVKIGDSLRIGTQMLTVAGFLRDSQMNSMMASSKRFLVNEKDYERLKSLGDEEYLIEFRLKKGEDVNAFSTAYGDANLPGNGPTITYPLIRLMNALSDGMMILVILLVSVVILAISILCIKYILLTSLEKDKKEIGMMKAIGISRRDIHNLYFSKFLILSLIGALIGVIAVLVISVPLRRQMNDLYGMPENMLVIYLLSAFGIMAVEGLILFSVHRTLRTTNKLTAVEALYGIGRFENKKNRYFFISVITAAATALILIPQNIASTLSSPHFVTYMGIGSSQIRIDIRQTERIEEISEKILSDIHENEQTDGAVLMETHSYRVLLEDGREYSLLIENGDHSKYPVNYKEGSWPAGNDEIALSVLNASELGLGVGDYVTIQIRQNDSDKTVRCRICGIYSDITNGGKTAKACFGNNEISNRPMWSVIYVTLKDPEEIAAWTDQYQKIMQQYDASIRVTDISQYVNATYGQTIIRIQKASVLTMFASSLVLAVVVLLFIRLMIWQEHSNCSLKKALGFISSEIRFSYMKRSMMYILIGMAAGVFLGLIPGQDLAGMLLGSLGASGFHFIIDPVRSFIIIPVIIITVSLISARISLMEIDRIKAYECCIGRE
ncbi:MAG: FtsX-like permease family protein, partial [Anaerolineaceae bacterium]|nr:FtsX-like permease family protein [Anaerolineaceae bacterium]